MPDQAEKLRQLVEAADVAFPPPDSDVQAPSIIAVTGGKGGVGATTVAVNLAVALAHLDLRVVLVDAAREHPDMSQVAGIHAHAGGSLADVLTGTCSAADALAPGPAGTLLLADRWARSKRPDFSRQAQQRLLAELGSLSAVADIVVVDTGSGHNSWTRRFWQRAALAVLVTTANDLAVMDTYATLKLATGETPEANVRVLINNTARAAEANAVGQRLATVSQRFLGRPVAILPHLPRQQSGAEVNAKGSQTELAASPPRVWESPNSPFGHAVLWLGRAVADAIVSHSAAASSADMPAFDASPNAASLC